MNPENHEGLSKFSRGWRTVGLCFFLKGLWTKQVGLKKMDGGLNKNGGPQGFWDTMILREVCVFNSPANSCCSQAGSQQTKVIPTAQACPVGCIPFATLHVRRARWSVFSLVVGKLRVGGDDYISTIYPMTDPCHIFKYLHIHTYSPYNFMI